MLIYLIGLPGSGKSTIGRILAHKLNYSYFDMDDAICDQEKKTIEDIFATKGENYFRELEHSILKESFRMKNTIVSTGGGAPCFFDNMEQMKKHGLTIYINPGVEELTNRLLSQGRENRPLLKGKSDKQLKDFLDIKTKERTPYYNQAKIIFSKDTLTAEDVYTRLKADGFTS
ncbi:MAG: shikimate kinase [Cytophagales bacterium]|nr:shikimate kinase [Cytophaga sp.]